MITVTSSGEKRCVTTLITAADETTSTSAFSNSFGLKNVFEKLRFRDELVCT